METRPPTVTRILVAVGFALSCFGLALFLWIAFGGPLPLKPEGYRFTVPFTEATQLAVESDVRISGVSVGKVKSIELSNKGDYADASIELDSPYAPIPDNTRAILRSKTLLGETYVELTPGIEERAVTAGGGQPAAGPGGRARCSSTRSSAPSASRRARTSRPGCRAPRRRSRGAARTSARRSPSSEPFSESANRALRILDTQQHAVRELVRSGGDVFQALSERQGQLRSLIQNSDRVFSTTAQRNQDLADTFRILPTFQRETRLTLQRLNTFAIDADPLVQQLGRQRSSSARRSRRWAGRRRTSSGSSRA